MSVYDEIMDGILWVAEQEGNGEEARRIYDKIKRRNASEEKRDRIIKEDTIKQGSHWVNKGKEGTHGKFKTKKAADAQRKAMFANSGKNRKFGEGLNESLYNIFYDYEDEHGYTYRDNKEEFEGDWHELQEYIKSMRRNGCYNIDAVWVRDDVRESCSRRRK